MLPFDTTKLSALACYIALGLDWHHWQAQLVPNAPVRASLFSSGGLHLFEQAVASQDSRARVAGSFGDGVFVYRGVRDRANPTTTWWQMTFFGGMEQRARQWRGQTAYSVFVATSDDRAICGATSELKFRNLNTVMPRPRPYTRQAHSSAYHMQFKAAREAHAGTVDALVSFMYDCRFDASSLTAATLSLALEYVYQPHPRFWGDFNMTFLIRALALRIPDWRAAANTPGHASKGANRLLTDVADYVRVNAFDEANAEMLRALPVHMRPADGATAFDWISAQLARKGMTAELEFARRDSDVCGDGALDVLHCIEEAAAGRTVERTGTLVSKVYRDAVMSSDRSAG